MILNYLALSRVTKGNMGQK